MLPLISSLYIYYLDFNYQRLHVLHGVANAIYEPLKAMILPLLEHIAPFLDFGQSNLNSKKTRVYRKRRGKRRLESNDTTKGDEEDEEDESQEEDDDGGDAA